MMTRTAMVEFRRGAGVAVMAVLAAGGAAMLFNETEDWAGRWGAFAEYVRLVLGFLAPIAVGVAVWHGSREGRRRITELVASTSRPQWQRTVLSWSTLAAGAGLGLVLACAPGMVLVARTASYGGGLWWLLMLGSLVLVMTATAVGFAVGRHWHAGAAAPIAGVVALAAWGFAGLLGADVGIRPEGGYLPWPLQTLQLGWLLALAAAALVLAGARRRKLAVAPAAVAVAFAVPLVAAGSPSDSWREDEEALERVCAGVEPRVCVSQEGAFLLDDMAAAADDALARLKTVPGAADVTIDVHLPGPSSGGRGGVEVVPYIGWDGSLSPAGEGGDLLRDAILNAAIPYPMDCHPPGRTEREQAAYGLLHDTVLQWAGQSTPPVGFIVEDGREIPTAELIRPMVERLTAMADGQQRAFVARYLQAAESCDQKTLQALVAELTA